MDRRTSSLVSFRTVRLVGAWAWLSACGDSTQPTPTDGATPTDAATSASDAGTADAGAVPTDAGAAAPDAAAGDAGCVPFTAPADCTIPAGSALPSSLACTGLYGDFAARSLACGVAAYTPAHTLYSDGAAKQRYVRLPEGGTIDASDPNELVFPVGTQLWKEFRIGPAQRLGETRLLQKTARGWVYTSYVWSEDGSTATQTNDGVKGLFGTSHDVPTRDQCNDCHVGRKDFALGWDGLLLGKGAEGLNAAALAAQGLFGAGHTLAPFAPEGDESTRAALAYLHVNCGVSCHNPNPKSKGHDTGLMLRIEVGDAGGTPSAVRTGVNRMPDVNAKLAGLSVPPGGYVDIAPGDPTRSLLLARMKVRGVEAQMPRQGTNVVDEAGVASVEAFIRALTP